MWPLGHGRVMTTQDIRASVSNSSKQSMATQSVHKQETDANDMKSNREWEWSERATE